MNQDYDQIGIWSEVKLDTGRVLDGRTWDQMPHDYQPTAEPFPILAPTPA